MRFTLGDDGRLLSFYIDDAVRTRLTNLGLEKKLNDLLSAGNEAMRLSRKQFWDGAGRGSGGTEGFGRCGGLWSEISEYFKARTVVGAPDTVSEKVFALPAISGKRHTGIGHDATL